MTASQSCLSTCRQALAPGGGLDFRDPWCQWHQAIWPLHRRRKTMEVSRPRRLRATMPLAPIHFRPLVRGPGRASSTSSTAGDCRVPLPRFSGTESEGGHNRAGPEGLRPGLWPLGSSARNVPRGRCTDRLTRSHLVFFFEVSVRGRWAVACGRSVQRTPIIPIRTRVVRAPLRPGR